MMAAFRSKAFDILLGGWTVVFGMAIPFLLFASPERIRVFSRLWVRGVLALLKYVVGLTHEVIGEDNRPVGPCLIVCNHQSTWETIALLDLFHDVTIVAKEELLRIPVFGWYLRRSPMITIDRDFGTQALRRMVDGAKGAFAENRPVLLFPEGTRKSPDEPIAFKRGVELLYGRLDASVLPVVVNSGRFWGIGDARKRSGVITVSLLPAIAAGVPGAVMMERAVSAMEAERLRIA